MSKSDILPVPHAEPEAGSVLGRLNYWVRLRFIGLRNRLITNPGFRDWVLKVPVLRRIAHREAAGLFDLAAGFVYSQVLAAFVALELPDALAHGPRTLHELAAKSGLQPAAMRRLLRAAAGIRLAEKLPGDRFALGPAGAALVGNPGVCAMITHHRHLYADLADPVALLRANREADTALGRFWRYAGVDPAERAGVLSADDTDAYSELMRTSQIALVEEVLAGFSFAGVRKQLDIGGGYGYFLTRVLCANPQLEGILFDLPSVAARAGERFAESGLTGRVQAIGGDFAVDPLPVGADLITLLRVLHDHDDTVVEALLRAAWQALPAEGRLLIAEPLADAPGFASVGDTYFGMYLFAMGTGRPRTAAELTAMLSAAGFERIRVRQSRMPLEGTLIEAQKPAL